LQAEFPQVAIRLVECRARLGTSGKVSNLVQMLPEARDEHVVINDSDILVSPRYLERVMRAFTSEQVGLVTAPYIGRTAERGKALTVGAGLEGVGVPAGFVGG